MYEIGETGHHRYTVRFDYAFTVDKTTAGTDKMNSCVTYSHLWMDLDFHLNALQTIMVS